MKITKNKLQQIVKEEALSLNESVALALAGKAILTMLASEGGRGVIAKVLRWPEQLMQTMMGLDDYVADKLGTESPDLLNKMQEFMTTVQSGPFTYAADFIEGLDDEEAGAIAGAMGASGAPAESGGKLGSLAPNKSDLQENKMKIAKTQLKHMIKEELTAVLND